MILNCVCEKIDSRILTFSGLLGEPGRTDSTTEFGARQVFILRVRISSVIGSSVITLQLFASTPDVVVEGIKVVVGLVVVEVFDVVVGSVVVAGLIVVVGLAVVVGFDVVVGSVVVVALVVVVGLDVVVGLVVVVGLDVVVVGIDVVVDVGLDVVVVVDLSVVVVGLPVDVTSAPQLTFAGQSQYPTGLKTKPSPHSNLGNSSKLVLNCRINIKACIIRKYIIFV